MRLSEEPMNEPHEPEPRVDRTAFSVADLDDDSEERAYWRSRTPAERLATSNSCAGSTMAMQLPAGWNEFLELGWLEDLNQPQ
jgi:hypothetical protein